VLEDPRPIPMTLEPLDDFLVVQTTEDESETRAGLILPASAETECSAGIVTAVGPEAEGIAPGDKVLFLKEAGYDVRFAGYAVKVLRRHELIARVHD
jgi:chaperonin GroES